MENFEINIVTHTKYDMAVSLINQFRNQVPNAFIRVWDNSPFESIYHAANEVRWHRFNPSLSRVWNWAIAQSATNLVLVTNEDIKLQPDWRSRLELELEENQMSLWYGPSRHFLFRRALLHRVGWFDERLTGFTYEDLDYIRRMNSVPVKHLYGTLSSLHETAVSLKGEVNRDMDPVDNEKFMSLKYHNQDTEQFYCNPQFETPNFYPKVEV